VSAIASKQKRTEDKNVVSELSLKVISAMDVLVGIATWFVVEDVVADELDTRMSSKYNPSTSALGELKLDTAYSVDAFSLITEDSLYSKIGVFWGAGNTIIFFRGKSSLAPVVAYDVEHKKLYPYPPSSVQSVMFYLLNPEAEAEARRLAKQLKLSPKASERVSSFEAILSSLPRSTSDVYIEYEIGSLGYVEADAILHFNSPFKVLNELEANGLGDNDRVETSYTVRLNAGRLVAYTITEDNTNDIYGSVELLLEKFVPTSELKLAKKILSEVEATAVKTYLIFKIAEKLENELGSS